MHYQFICKDENCNNIQDFEKPMVDPFPDKIICNKCGKEMRRDYLGESGSKATIIPEHMKATSNSPNFKYDKRPSGKQSNKFFMGK